MKRPQMEVSSAGIGFVSPRPRPLARRGADVKRSTPGLALVLLLTTFAPGALAELSWLEALDGRVTDLSGREEIRLVFLGDTGFHEGFTLVGKGLAQYCENEGCDLGLLLGDNFYRGITRRGPRSPTSRSFDKYVYRPLAGLPAGFDLWALVGNHGYVWPGRPRGQIGHTFLPPRPDAPDWLMPDHAFAIPKLPSWLAVYGLDTYAVLKEKEGWRRNVEGIEESLCGAPGWRVLAGHHPAYTTGHHAKDEDEQIPVRERVLPELERCRGHLFLAGHDHQQQLIDAGSFVQVIQGAGSGLRPEKDLGLPDGVVSLGFWERLGFGVATFRQDDLTLRFYTVSEDGQAPAGVQISPLLGCSWTRAEQAAAEPGWLERACGLPGEGGAGR